MNANSKGYFVNDKDDELVSRGLVGVAVTSGLLLGAAVGGCYWGLLLGVVGFTKMRIVLFNALQQCLNSGITAAKRLI